MNQTGVFYNDQHIPFDSNVFLKKALYIEGFAESLLEWLKADVLPATLIVKSSENVESVDLKLDNLVYIHDNVPIEKR